VYTALILCTAELFIKANALLFFVFFVFADCQFIGTISLLILSVTYFSCLFLFWTKKQP